MVTFGSPIQVDWVEVGGGVTDSYNRSSDFKWVGVGGSDRTLVKRIPGLKSG